MADRNTSKFHQIPDALWERIDLVLPIYQPQFQRRPSTVADAERRRWHLLRAVHRLSVEGDAQQFGSGSAIHAYFQEWVEARCVRGAVANSPWASTMT